MPITYRCRPFWVGVQDTIELTAMMTLGALTTFQGLTCRYMIHCVYVLDHELNMNDEPEPDMHLQESCTPFCSVFATGHVFTWTVTIYEELAVGIICAAGCLFVGICTSSPLAVQLPASALDLFRCCCPSCRHGKSGQPKCSIWC